MDIKIQGLVRRNAETRFKKARFYAAFRVSQSPKRTLTGKKGAFMNFGQNLYNWFLSNAQSLVLLAIVVIGLYLGFKREFSKLIGFLVVSLVAVGLVFNADGVKDILLELFNKIIGA